MNNFFPGHHSLGDLNIYPSEQLLSKVIPHEQSVIIVQYTTTEKLGLILTVLKSVAQLYLPSNAPISSLLHISLFSSKNIMNSVFHIASMIIIMGTRTQTQLRHCITPDLDSSKGWNYLCKNDSMMVIHSFTTLTHSFSSSNLILRRQ